MEKKTVEKRFKLLKKMEIKNILNLSVSKEHPNVFGLGIADKYGISIVEQQKKAFLLAKTLIESRKINRNTNVAVIGGGVSGLSFAVAVATKKKCKVTVYEKESCVLPLLTRVYWRWVVPIYDFEQDLYFSKKTNLPFLNWEANYSWTVARDLKRKWEVYKSHFHINEVLNAKIKFLKSDKTKKPLLLVNKKEKQFDIIVVATGFNQVEELIKRDNYWTSGQPESYLPVRKNEKVLISGNGDAGLVELFHFCLKDFYHDDILKFYDWRARGSTLQSLKEAMQWHQSQIEYFRKSLHQSDKEKLYWFDFLMSTENSKRKESLKKMTIEKKSHYMDNYYYDKINSHKKQFDKMFKNINFSKEYLKFLSKHISNKFKVTLNGVDELIFDAEKAASIHNMLLASALYKLRVYEYISGKLENGDELENKFSCLAKIGTQKIKFDRVVVRHSRAIGSFPNLTFHSSLSILKDDEEIAFNWASIINQDYTDFFHDKKIKSFTVLNYLDEVSQREASLLLNR